MKVVKGTKTSKSLISILLLFLSRYCERKLSLEGVGKRGEEGHLKGLGTKRLFVFRRPINLYFLRFHYK